MAWEDVNSNKATEKQIQYAEKLMELIYGEIVTDVHSMDVRSASKLIDDLKHKIDTGEIHMNPKYRR